MPTETFPQRLRKAMSQNRLSQSDVARAVGYTPTAVWNWLQGNTLPRVETLTALAGSLGVSEDWLRNGESSQAEQGRAREEAASSETIAERVESLRVEIAALAGYDVDRVKLTLEFR
jgi:transcriptional regulator with XRE-family HTH domain